MSVTSRSAILPDLAADARAKSGICASPNFCRSPVMRGRCFLSEWCGVGGD
jgi:hypothetical protein